MWSACQKLNHSFIPLAIFCPREIKAIIDVDFEQFNFGCELVDVRGKTEEEAIEILEAFIHYMSLQLSIPEFHDIIYDESWYRHIKRIFDVFHEKQTPEEARQSIIETHSFLLSRHLRSEKTDYSDFKRIKRQAKEKARKLVTENEVVQRALFGKEMPEDPRRSMILKEVFKYF